MSHRFHIQKLSCGAREEQVNQINQRLKEDGFSVKPLTQLHTWTFYVEAPGNFTVEVYHYKH